MLSSYVASTYVSHVCESLHCEACDLDSVSCFYIASSSQCCDESCNITAPRQDKYLKSQSSGTTINRTLRYRPKYLIAFFFIPQQRANVACDVSYFSKNRITLHCD